MCNQYHQLIYPINDVGVVMFAEGPLVVGYQVTADTANNVHPRVPASLVLRARRRAVAKP